MKLDRMASSALIVVTGAVLGGSAAVIAADLPHSSDAAAARAIVPAVVKPAPAQYHPAPVLAGAPVPVTLVIPRLGIAAPVERVDPTPELMLGVPSKTTDVAWYDLGVSPGEAGDAVLVGHLDSETGGPAVFQNLSALVAGDVLVTRLAGGREVRFRVTRSFWTAYTRVPDGLLDNTGPARLSLITCAGAWDAGKKTYSQRLVVQATAIQ